MDITSPSGITALDILGVVVLVGLIALVIYSRRRASWRRYAKPAIASARLVPDWLGDTNLYRSSATTLRTDGELWPFSFALAPDLADQRRARVIRKATAYREWVAR